MQRKDQICENNWCRQNLMLSWELNLPCCWKRKQARNCCCSICIHCNSCSATGNLRKQKFRTELIKTTSEVVVPFIAVIDNFHFSQCCCFWWYGCRSALPCMKIQVVRISCVSYPLEGVTLCWHVDIRKHMKCILSNGNSDINKEAANIFMVT